jgi:hypothetical protein
MDMCSTSLPGGNQVECLPPVSNTAVRDISFESGPELFAWATSFVLVLKSVYVVNMFEFNTTRLGKLT